MGIVLVIGLGLAGIIAAAFVLKRLRKPGSSGYSTEAIIEPGGPGAEPDLSGYPCGHEIPDGPSIVEVYGVKMAVDRAPICPDCLEDWLNRNSTRCASCDGPILPGMPVGQAWRGARFPYTHMTADCTETGGLYCGRWGQKRLITLHELEPDKYPAGTSSVMAHVYKTGKPTSGNIG